MSVDVIERMREAAHGAYIHLTRADVERMARVLLKAMAAQSNVGSLHDVYIHDFARSIDIDLTATASGAQVAAQGELRHSPGDTQP